MLKSSFHAVDTGYRKTIAFLAHHKTYTAFSFVILSLIVIYSIFSTPKEEVDTHTLQRGNLRQYVQVTGQVESSKDANLSFQTAGAVAFVGVKPGDEVVQGKLLATIVAGDARANLLLAEANLAKEEATLAQLIHGARAEEIAIKEQTMKSAEAALNQVYGGFPEAVKNVDAVTADIVKSKFSPLFTFDISRYVLSFTSCDQRLQSEIELRRTELENTLADFQKKSSVISAISSKDALDKAFAHAYETTVLTNELVADISTLLLLPCSTSNSALDTYRTNLSTVKTSINTLFTDINTRKSSLVTAQNTLEQAKKDLDLTKAGTDPYKIRVANASVGGAKAQVESAQALLSKTIISAPFNGTISDVDITTGETVTQGKTAISMLASNSFEIKAQIPEIDIVKIAQGQDVEVTLDAYGNQVIFPATITRLNPKSTTKGSVPVYTAIVTFKGADARIKEGMTANIKIITEEKTDVLLIPARYLILEGKDTAQVIVRKDRVDSNRTIQLGARGDNGTYEVKDGLIGTEVVVAPPLRSQK